MCNYNVVHGPSTLTVLSDKEPYRASFSTAVLQDELFEFIYAAEEVFADGAKCIKLCWRQTDQKFLASQNTKFVAPKNRPTTTFCQPFTWNWK